MPFVTNWDDFAKAAEILYLADPMKGHPVNHSIFVGNCGLGSTLQARFSLKYRHCDGKLVIKITDNLSCIQYATEHTQDVKKIEKLTSQLMRHMASKEK